MSEPERKGCDSCKHALFSVGGRGVVCLHPQRPCDKREVVRWYTGCPQHQPKESK